MQYIEKIRPSKMSQFVGKKDIIDSLNIGIQVAKKTNLPLDHTLFYGPAGVGKTSLAQIIANEMNSKIKIIQSGNIKTLPDLIGLLTTLKNFDILFVDEIHALKTNLMEILYPVLEDNLLDIVVGKKYNSKLIRLKLPKFTLIAATTNFGILPKSLEERFGYIFFVDTYSKRELIQIIQNTSEKIKITLSKKEMEIIEENSRGTPRNCNRILKRVKDYSILGYKTPIQKIIHECGYVYKGLTVLDIKYLNFLKNEINHTSGFKSLVQSVNLDEKTIQCKIEPFLLKMQYIVKIHKGRKLTQKGLKITSKIQQITPKLLQD